MDDFMTVVKALLGGFASGPLGWFAAALCVSSITMAVIAILVHDHRNTKSKED